MIRVTKTQPWHLEMPKTCIGCPMHHSINDGSASIEICKLKKNKNWEDNTINVRTMKTSRDINCPLVDGHSYTI